jgi:hypothetical protein
LLWMTRWGHVIKAIFMCNQSCGHSANEPVSRRIHKLLPSKNIPAGGIKVSAGRAYSGANIYPAPRTVCK